MANFNDVLNNDPAIIPEKDQQFSKEEYAAERKIKRENTFALADQTALEVAVDGNRFREYLDVQSRFGRFSANNALLILAQRPDATRIGELSYWRGQKVFIKSSEIQKDIAILKQGDEYRRDDGSVGVFYNVVKAYDISQADRKRLSPELPSYGERQLLSALVKGAPMKIKSADELPDDLGAMTDPETGDISVRSDMDFPDTFRSVAQELSHAELTSDASTQSDPQFSAYCSSYLVCKKYGVDTQKFSFDKAPDTLDGMDAKEVKSELSQIRAAAENISGRMARQIEAQQKAATAKSQDAR
jgi:hypothetical protein